MHMFGSSLTIASVLVVVHKLTHERTGNVPEFQQTHRYHIIPLFIMIYYAEC